MGGLVSGKAPPPAEAEAEAEEEEEEEVAASNWFVAPADHGELVALPPWDEDGVHG